MNKNYVWRAFVFNPLVVIFYGMGCYYLTGLAQYGGIFRRAPIVLSVFLILFIWFSWCLFKYWRGGLTFADDASRGVEILSKWWTVIATFALFSITLATGMSIYQSGTNYQGKLAFYIQQLIDTRKVELVHGNVYEDGVDGLFEDLDRKLDLPEELYLAAPFELSFAPDGEITSLYSFFYGVDEDEETKSYLLSYDSGESEDITVHLDGFADPDFEEAKKMQPLIEMIEEIPVEEVVSDWDEEEFGIYYEGVRNWGYSTNGIVYMDEEGAVQHLETAQNETIGYSVSVYAPENTSITPMRFVEFAPQFGNLYEEAKTPVDPNPGAETFFLNQELGYQLVVMDAALGSRFYALNKTTDSGLTWETHNPDPFLGTLGTASGITFLDEELGFIGLSKAGGSYAMLYRTTDGGVTFERVELPPVEVALTETENYIPFDFPEMPYMGHEKLMLMVNQGQDGDHNGGSKALYQSEDDGATWEFVEEIR